MIDGFCNDAWTWPALPAELLKEILRWVLFWYISILSLVRGFTLFMGAPMPK
jgi:hypothetical protein